MLTGIVTTLLGPLIPFLSAQWQLDDSQAGYLFTAQFAGSMVGVAISSSLITRIGFIRSLAAGFGLMTAGVGGLAFGTWSSGMASISCWGIGLGITIPTTNLLISEANPTRRASALNILNFAWSIGAVAGPPLIALLIRSGRTTMPIIGLSALLAAVAAWMALYSPAVQVEEPSETDAVGLSGNRVWRSPFIPLLGTLAFIYVGTENAIAGWAASYALRLDSAPKSLWALAPSVFWAALLCGRAAAPLFLRRVAEDRLVLIGLGGAGCGVVLIIATPAVGGLLAGVGVAGLGLATVFPTALAMLSRFGRSASRVAGLVFAMASLGGATIPWVVGFVSTRSGSLRTGMLVPLVGTLIMMALQVSIISLLIRARNNQSDDSILSLQTTKR